MVNALQGKKNRMKNRKRKKIKKEEKIKNSNQEYLPTRFLLPYCLIDDPVGVV